MMRGVWLVLHRWLGLGTALFLFIAGLTGALISWDHELDEWLNPQLFEAPNSGPALPALSLVARFEASHPEARVRYFPLRTEPGHSYQIMVEPRLNPATGQLFALSYNQVALDPANGAVLGQRMWGEISLARENILPFLYKLHYSLHLPEGGDIEWGIWLMGIVAVVWTLDSLIALYLAFPNWRQWRRSFALRWSAGGHKLVFDLHRSGGVWLFALLLMLAVTSVAMNLNSQLMRPLVGWFSPLSASPFDERSPAPLLQPIDALISPAQLLARAEPDAKRLGLQDPAGAVFLSSSFGIWGVGFFKGENSHGDGGLGNPWLYYDSRSGAALGQTLPGQGSAGDIFLQSMFPLHSGRILGLPGRVLISALGLAVAGFSLTGFLIWLRKRRARLAARAATLARLHLQECPEAKNNAPDPRAAPHAHPELARPRP